MVNHCRLLPCGSRSHPVLEVAVCRPNLKIPVVFFQVRFQGHSYLCRLLLFQNSNLSLKIFFILGSFHPGLQDRHMVRCCEVSEDVKASALTRPTHEFSTHGTQGRQRSAHTSWSTSAAGCTHPTRRSRSRPTWQPAMGLELRFPSLSPSTVMAASKFIFSWLQVFGLWSEAF